MKIKTGKSENQNNKISFSDKNRKNLILGKMKIDAMRMNLILSKSKKTKNQYIINFQCFNFLKTENKKSNQIYF